METFIRAVSFLQQLGHEIFGLHIAFFDLQYELFEN